MRVVCIKKTPVMSTTNRYLEATDKKPYASSDYSSDACFMNMIYDRRNLIMNTS